jgi:ribonuclease R
MSRHTSSRPSSGGWGQWQRDGQFMQNRRGDWLIPNKADLVRGRIVGHPDGYGFLVRGRGRADLFLGSEGNGQGPAWRQGHRARIVGVDRGPAGGQDRRGAGARQTASSAACTTSTACVRGGREPAHQPGHPAGAPEKGSRKSLKAQAGQVVVVELIEQPSKHSQPIGTPGRGARQLCRSGHGNRDRAAQARDALRVFRRGLAQTRKLPDAVRKSDWKEAAGRTSRNLPLVTIDGETARDFDDAVYCERRGKGFRLVVAIADVSHYVHGRQCARHRGLSSAATRCISRAG